MVSPETSSSSRGYAIKRRVSQQPADFRQGVANAYNVVTEVSYYYVTALISKIFYKLSVKIQLVLRSMATKSVIGLRIWSVLFVSF